MNNQLPSDFFAQDTQHFEYLINLFQQGETVSKVLNLFRLYEGGDAAFFLVGDGNEEFRNTHESTHALLYFYIHWLLSQQHTVSLNLSAPVKVDSQAVDIKILPLLFTQYSSFAEVIVLALQLGRYNGLFPMEQVTRYNKLIENGSHDLASFSLSDLLNADELNAVDISEFLKDVINLISGSYGSRVTLNSENKPELQRNYGQIYALRKELFLNLLKQIQALKSDLQPENKLDELIRLIDSEASQARELLTSHYLVNLESVKIELDDVLRTVQDLGKIYQLVMDRDENTFCLYAFLQKLSRSEIEVDFSTESAEKIMHQYIQES